MLSYLCFFFFSSRRRHTRWNCDWSSDVCSSDLDVGMTELRRELGFAMDRFDGLEVAVGTTPPLERDERAMGRGVGADPNVRHPARCEGDEGLVDRTLRRHGRHSYAFVTGVDPEEEVTPPWIVPSSSRFPPRPVTDLVALSDSGAACEKSRLPAMGSTPLIRIAVAPVRIPTTAP